MMPSQTMISMTALARDEMVLDAHRQETPSPHHPGLRYRPDIDGLRAVAVLSVLGFHLNISWLTGGFVGVDIFFVISGYLIGSIIINSAKKDEFSVVKFYVGRIRRIVPALVVMILLCFILSYFILFPAEYKRLAYSTIFAALSVSNLYFFYNTGYFNPLAATQPLLHTWSLGVEEQFYIVFPIFVVLLMRWSANLLNACMAVVWIASFSWSAYGAFAHPEATFYLAHPRAWELLLGTLVANQSWTAQFSSFTRNAMALLGAALIALAIFTYTFETPFPGAAAFVPCFGAALIIAAGQSGEHLVGRLLSLKPVVFVGLISYSLYLWHWPIAFFQHSNSILISTDSERVARLAILACSFIVATLSWGFVERPIRNLPRSTSSWKIFTGGSLGLGSLAALGLLVISGNGLPQRFTPASVEYASYLDYGEEHLRGGKCFIVAPYRFSDFDKHSCLDLANGESNYLLIGDSHAAHFWYGLSERLRGVHVLQATAAGCLPALNQPAAVAASCNSLMAYIFNDYLVNNHVDRLLVAGRWIARDIPALEQTLAWAKARAIPVTLLGPIVEYDLALPRVLAYAAQHNEQDVIGRHRIKNDEQLDEILQSLATKYDAKYISLYKLLCSPDRCTVVSDDGAPLEFDTDHLTREGSLFVIEKLVESKLLP
jgi:peptidoglycan/LPS O-acetylase OafA/YrhL